MLVVEDPKELLCAACFVGWEGGKVVLAMKFVDFVISCSQMKEVANYQTTSTNNTGNNKNTMLKATKTFCCETERAVGGRDEAHSTPTGRMGPKHIPGKRSRNATDRAERLIRKGFFLRRTP